MEERWVIFGAHFPICQAYYWLLLTRTKIGVEFCSHPTITNADYKDILKSWRWLKETEIQFREYGLQNIFEYSTTRHALSRTPKRELNL